jgi:hypothetical protein
MEKKPKGASGKKPQRRTEYNVTPEEFIKAWQQSDSPQEVADLLKMPKAIVLARASNYRDNGIRLKKMKRGQKRKLDVEALNALIDELEAEGLTPP